MVNKASLPSRCTDSVMRPIEAIMDYFDTCRKGRFASSLVVAKEIEFEMGLEPSLPSSFQAQSASPPFLLFFLAKAHLTPFNYCASLIYLLQSEKSYF